MAPTTPLAKMGWPPIANLGVVRPPIKGKKKKEKWVKMGFEFLGVASATPYSWYGVAKATLSQDHPFRHEGGSTTPKPAVGGGWSQSQFSSFFFSIFIF